MTAFQAAKCENAKLRTLLGMHSRHWLTAKWLPAAANDTQSGDVA